MYISTHNLYIFIILWESIATFIQLAEGSVSLKKNRTRKSNGCLYIILMNAANEEINKLFDIAVDISAIILSSYMWLIIEDKLIRYMLETR